MELDQNKNPLYSKGNRQQNERQSTKGEDIHKKTFIISQFLWVDNLGMAYRGSCVSWCLMRLQSKHFPELQSFEGLTGAGGPISMVTHSQAVGRGLSSLPHGPFQGAAGGSSQHGFLLTE